MKMKYISTLFIAIAILAVGTVKAQNASKLNSQSYTYMMKNADGTGPEIIDKMVFGVGEATSDELAKTGFTKATVKETNAGATSDFELTFKNATGSKYYYKGKAEGVEFHGTLSVTNANGTVSEMLFRGLLTEEWNHITEQKAIQRKQAEQERQH